MSGVLTELSVDLPGLRDGEWGSFLVGEASSVDLLMAVAGRSSSLNNVPNNNTVAGIYKERREAKSVCVIAEKLMQEARLGEIEELACSGADVLLVVGGGSTWESREAGRLRQQKNNAIAENLKPVPT